MFYRKDWQADCQLQQASFQTRGMWLEFLLHMMDSPTPGRISGTQESLGRLIGATPKELESFFAEVSLHKFANVTKRNGKITLENRRMLREEKARRDNAERQRRHRRKRERNEHVTLYANENGIEVQEGEGAGEGGAPAFQIQAIFDCWQSEACGDGPLIFNKKLTSVHKAAAAGALNDWDIAVICEAIRNYAAVLKGDNYYWDHSWPFEHFLERGLSRFVTEANPFKTFRIRGKGFDRVEAQVKQYEKEIAAMEGELEAAKTKGRSLKVQGRENTQEGYDIKRRCNWLVDELERLKGKVKEAQK